MLLHTKLTNQIIINITMKNTQKKKNLLKPKKDNEVMDAIKKTARKGQK